jgi:hypothetical protein
MKDGLYAAYAVLPSLLAFKIPTGGGIGLAVDTKKCLQLLREKYISVFLTLTRLNKYPALAHIDIHLAETYYLADSQSTGIENNFPEFPGLL